MDKSGSERDEEVEALLEAIKALGSTEPAAVRARQLTQLLDEWPTLHSEVRALRQEAVAEMKNDGMSLRAIAAELAISFGRVRDILQGVTKRPKKDDAQQP
ncbi:hypothetical protein VSR01_16365 [Actinacidiphila sp. DG2A-62]|uniref:hypothetical protein n=1 Tax=Actinacidiphila sp. DG2A-62 TaxID=3108821 RepID=UPI002DB573A1|nr:hypothetical protein [Actinacidiphila sp. DG2A-62]MEC3995020.1 hypothetical protein [Actinacidiphila sp. DG2A-62]